MSKMSKKLPDNSFEWIDDLSNYNEDFINHYDENSDKVYIFEVDIEHPKILFRLHSDLPFLPKRKKN